MNYLNIQPGKIVKETYTVTETRVAEAQQPVVDGRFSAPYTAKINLELGMEKIDIYASNGNFSSDIATYKNNTKAQRLLTLGKVVGKIVSGEMKSIFGKGQSPINYRGINVAGAVEAIDNAKESYNDAYKEYLQNLPVEKSQEKLVSSNTKNIAIRNSSSEFLDDLLLADK